VIKCDLSDNKIMYDKWRINYDHHLGLKEAPPNKDKDRD